MPRRPEFRQEHRPDQPGRPAHDDAHRAPRIISSWRARSYHRPAVDARRLPRGDYSHAGVAEPVDARDLKSLGPLALLGSTPSPGTMLSVIRVRVGSVS